MKIIQLLTCITLLVCFACNPDEDTIELGALPNAPEISVRQLPESPNFVEVELRSTTGIYEFIWDTPGGNPEFSQAIKDTIFYVSAGEYDISVHISATDGNGTSTAKETVAIAADAQGICDDFLELLTACDTKCWKLSEAPGSVKVGPSELSGEWFTSPSLDPSQIDDRFCFSAEGFQFEYFSGDGTFSACAGYINVSDFPNPPDTKFSTSPINSEYADIEITFNQEIYLGTEDSGPFYQVASLTEEEMVLLAPIKPCDGSPSTGWFTYTFLAAE